MDLNFSQEASAAARRGQSVRGRSSSGVHTVRARNARDCTFVQRDFPSGEGGARPGKPLKAIESFGVLLSTASTSSVPLGVEEKAAFCWSSVLESQMGTKSRASVSCEFAEAFLQPEELGGCSSASCRGDAAEPGLPEPLFSFAGVHAFAREEDGGGAAYERTNSLQLRLPPSPRSLAREEFSETQQRALAAGEGDRRIRFASNDILPKTASEAADGKGQDAEGGALVAVSSSLQELLSVKSPGDSTFSVRKCPCLSASISQASSPNTRLAF